MFEHMTEEQARAQILEQVAGYCDTFHKKAPYREVSQNSRALSTRFTISSWS